MGVRDIQGSGGWTVETTTDDANHPREVGISINSRRGSLLTPAGMQAVLAAYAAYLTGAKAAAMARAASRGQVPAVTVSQNGATFGVLAADVNTVVATINAILQSAANVELH